MQRTVNSNKNDKNIKMILIGESGTGKSSLINTYNGNDFMSETVSSLSSNFIKKEVKINDNTYNLKLWDTAGQERFRSLNKIYIKDSQIVVFVYDITQKKTFDELSFWVNYVNEIIPKAAIFGLVGNKSDLVEEIINGNNNEDILVNTDDGENYADEIGALFYETSAKDDRAGFANYINLLIAKFISEKKNSEKELEILALNNNQKKKKKKNCC